MDAYERQLSYIAGASLFPGKYISANRAGSGLSTFQEAAFMNSLIKDLVDSLNIEKL